MNYRLQLFLTITVASLCLSCAIGAAQRKKSHTFSINTGSEKRITGCDQVRMKVDDQETIYSELDRTLPGGAGSSIKVVVAERGGVHVQGWDGDHYAIKACLGAAGENAAEGQRILGQISLSVDGGIVTTNGPKNEDWMAYLIIQAPNGATMNLESRNSPIGISTFSGTVEVRNQNGPVSLYDVGGQVRADVRNGPISVTGNRGDHRLNVQNGPITIDLTGSRWESGELEGHSQNGPLTLMLPPDYQSPVRVDTSKHSPVECRAAQCKESLRTWENPSRIEFGGSTPVIRLSTVNGPVTIISGDREKSQ
ncbi:MAG: hypothetical protein L0220_13890 [Acidobacteria bacterium]|nr:hypothetical protein [Acidobacteriota bacterium]